MNDIVIAGMDAELFFETGLEIRAGSPPADTFALGPRRRLSRACRAGSYANASSTRRAAAVTSASAPGRNGEMSIS